MSQPATNGSEAVDKGEALGGRPTKYEGEKTDKVAARMALIGATERDIAMALGIDTSTLWRWKREHDTFCNALTVDKAVYDDRVERSLAQRALGYEIEEEKVYFPSGSKEPVKVSVKKHVPASDTAAIFWLKNRRPDMWRDRQDLNLQVNDGMQQITTEDLEKRLMERMKDVTPKGVTHEDE